MSHEQTARRVPLAAPFDRQVRRGGGFRDTALSVVLHVALIAALVAGGRQAYVDATRGPGENTGRGGGGGGGGGAIRAYTLYLRTGSTEAPPPPPTPVPPPITAPAVTPTSIPEPVAQPTPTPAPPAAPAPGEGSGPGTGTGTGPGSGSGTGGGAGSGVGPGTGSDTGAGGGGGTVFPPSPQGMILPPPGRPGSMRGLTLTVTFRISARGVVDEVIVDPPIRDRKYRDEFLDRMRRYTFSPAYTRDGRPIAAEFEIHFTL